MGISGTIFGKVCGRNCGNSRNKRSRLYWEKFPDEYSGSLYTRKSKGARAKAKANAAQGIMEMIEIAAQKVFCENRKEKHSQDAQKGWYYYHTRFALPLYNNKNKTEEYNAYTACLVINCASNGKLYLYDIVDIKKEASNPLKTENSQVVQNRFF